MPRLIPEADFSGQLTNSRTNRHAAKSFLAKYPIPYEVDGLRLPEGYSLLSNRKGTAIRVIDKNDSASPRIVYAVDIEITDKKIGSKSCTQVMVWADPSNEDELVGLPKKVFNNLLQEYAIIISDSEQTPDGKRFWERRILQSMNSGFFVYYVDTNQLGSLERIHNREAFFDHYLPIGWGNDKEHQGRLFVISVEDIL